MMKNQLAGLMKQAQAMQDNLKKAQDELATIEVEGHPLRGFHADPGQAAQRLDQRVQAGIGHPEAVRTASSCPAAAACRR